MTKNRFSIENLLLFKRTWRKKCKGNVPLVRGNIDVDKM